MSADMVVEDMEISEMQSMPQQKSILGREVKPDMEAKKELGKKMVAQYRNMAKDVSREVKVRTFLLPSCHHLPVSLIPSPPSPLRAVQPKMRRSILTRNTPRKTRD